MVNKFYEFIQLQAHNVISNFVLIQVWKHFQMEWE